MGESGNPSHSVDGLIDDVQIWNKRLNDYEIQQLMQNPPTGVEENLVGYWNFENDNGVVVNDVSSFNNSGAYTGVVTNTPLSFDTPNYANTSNLKSFSSSENGEYVLVPNSASLDITSSITIALWVKLNSYGGGFIVPGEINSKYNMYVNKWEGSTHQYVFANNNKSDNGIYLYFSQEGNNSQASAKAFIIAEVHAFIAVTYSSINISCSASDSINISFYEDVIAPTGPLTQVFCNTATVLDLTATAENIQWYDADTGGNLLDSSTALSDGQMVYASQTVNGCESTDRLEVTVSIQDITLTASATEVCAGESVNLTAISGTCSWFNSVHISRPSS